VPFMPRAKASTAGRGYGRNSLLSKTGVGSG
jgi:hypothetical protein